MSIPSKYGPRLQEIINDVILAVRKEGPLSPMQRYEISQLREQLRELAEQDPPNTDSTEAPP